MIYCTFDLFKAFLKKILDEPYFRDKKKLLSKFSLFHRCASQYEMPNYQVSMTKD